ncbi:hypothetical protein [Martelella alba]|uniref:Uncharacterized protein n=1 Tax=Martelella alba TaxID=2590451 RepID=A0ABY2SNW7_9HYPH|nr:hypothetical protein [Martelella alba]TKI06989.1 hypothetical protein FCN80_08575 [Martelella alba]
MKITVLDNIVYQGINYTIIPIDHCIPIGQALNDEGGRWHIHVLPPGCQYNPFASCYSMVIEDDDGQIAYLAQSDVFPEADKVLVKLLHGDGIMAGNPDIPVETPETEDTMRYLITSLVDKKIAWHHHMHFPSCLLNPLPGKWTLSVESELGTQIEAFDEEPLALLGFIESRFFSTLKNR